MTPPIQHLTYPDLSNQHEIVGMKVRDLNTDQCDAVVGVELDCGWVVAEIVIGDSQYIGKCVKTKGANVDQVVNPGARLEIIDRVVAANILKHIQVVTLAAVEFVVSLAALKRLPDWLLTVGVGAVAGLLVGPEPDNNLLLLFLVWQAAVAGCIGYALTRR